MRISIKYYTESGLCYVVYKISIIKLIKTPSLSCYILYFH